MKAIVLLLFLLPLQLVAQSTEPAKGSKTFLLTLDSSVEEAYTTIGEKLLRDGYTIANTIDKFHVIETHNFNNVPKGARKHSLYIFVQSVEGKTVAFIYGFIDLDNGMIATLEYGSSFGYVNKTYSYVQEYLKSFGGELTYN